MRNYIAAIGLGLLVAASGITAGADQDPRLISRNADITIGFTAEEVPGGSTALTWNGMTFTDDMDAVIWNDYSALAT
jgi:hypothetical protein